MSEPAVGHHPLVRPQAIIVKVELMTFSGGLLQQIPILEIDGNSPSDWWKDCNGYQNWQKVGWIGVGSMAKFKVWPSPYVLLWKPERGHELGVTPGFRSKVLMPWCGIEGVPHVYVR
jgi:hypothetical protein